MRNAPTRSKSALFLIELIIGIGFFSVASAICIQLFVGAHNLSRHSADLTRSLYLATGAAEAFKATGGDADRIAGYLGAGAQVEGGTITAHYDRDWNRTPVPEPGGYRLHVTLDLAASPAAADIRVESDGGELLYATEAKAYLGGEVVA